MASLGKTFKATDHNTEQCDYEQLPNGIYVLEVEAADVAPTSNGNGTILKTTMRVVEPAEYEGRKLFNNYNLENANAKAQEIGQQQFAALCRAMSIEAVDDTDDILFHSFTAKVALGKPSKDGQYPARAEIKRYYFPDQDDMPAAAIDASQPARPAPANDNRPATRAAAPAAGATKPAGSRPWGKK